MPHFATKATRMTNVKKFTALAVTLTALIAGSIQGAENPAAGAVSPPLPGTYTSFYVDGDADTTNNDPTPDLVPLIDCVWKASPMAATQTVWFGYRLTRDTVTDIGNFPALIKVGASNQIVERTATGTNYNKGPNRSQPDHFLVGVHHGVFAVKLGATRSAIWSLTSSSTDVSYGAGWWTVIVDTTNLPVCPQTTGAKSAVAQTTAAFSGAPQVTTTLTQTNLGGYLTASQITLSVLGVVSKCSAGGTALAPQVQFGFDQLNEINLTPVAIADVQRVDTFGVTNWTRTANGVRTIANPQAANGQGFVPTKGYARLEFMADVYGVCKYGTTVVTSALPLWVDTQGFRSAVDVVTNTTTTLPRFEYTRAATCPTVQTCEYNPFAFWPGGTRYR